MKRFFALLIGVLCLSCKTSELIREPSQEYAKENIVGAWFGFAQADIYVYRIQLTSSGSGIGACYSNFSKSRTNFKIESWALKGINHLSMHIALGSELRAIEGDLITTSMFVGEVYGRNGWSNSVSFYKEAPFEQRMKNLRQNSSGDQKGIPQTIRAN